MLLSLLYSSPLLKTNIHRNIYIYVLAMMIYVAIHWVLFSSIGDKYALIQKYRYAFYVIVAIDVIYTSTKYKEFIASVNQTTPVNKTTSPVVEEIVDSQCARNKQHQKRLPQIEQPADKPAECPARPQSPRLLQPQPQQQPEQPPQQMQSQQPQPQQQLPQQQMQQPQEPIEQPHQKETDSVKSLPVYTSNQQPETQPLPQSIPNSPSSKQSNDDIPVYTGKSTD